MFDHLISKVDNRRKPRILIFCDYYLPGYKSGGGMRTIVNMVDRLHSKYDFWIVTRDHDGTHDLNQYETVKINDWNAVQHAQVLYLPEDAIKILKLRELILDVKPELYYANSFFANPSIFLVMLRKLRLIPAKNIVIAPCGELSEGSLTLKRHKKLIFITWSKVLGLYKNIIWKASSELERAEINKIKGSAGKILISPDLPPKKLNENYSQDLKPPKLEGSVKMIFLSRFVKKKNFSWLLDNLYAIEGNLAIDIFGPLEDESYWNECFMKIKELPANIRIESKGSIQYEETGKLLLDYHFFILPTLSENFGHVFLEALAAGCPLVISDRTPWLELSDKGIGWDISLENPEEWVLVLNKCIAMKDEEYRKRSSDARNYAVNWLSDESVEKQTVDLLDFALSPTQSV